MHGFIKITKMFMSNLFFLAVFKLLQYYCLAHYFLLRRFTLKASLYLKRHHLFPPEIDFSFSAFAGDVQLNLQ